jgi:lysophospholipase L1-like esterase
MLVARIAGGERMAGAGRGRRALGNAALLLASTLLTLLAVEGCLRLLHARRHARIAARHPTRELCTAPHPRLVYTLVPNRCGANSRGFPDAERELAKPAGTLRLVVIGDSVAAGDGVPPGASFPRVLERELASRLAPTPVEVVTLARSGYSTSQELLVFEEEGLRHQPDLVVWSYVLNDPAHPVFHDANGELGRFHHAPRVHALHFVRRKLFQARERWRRHACPAEYHARLHCVYAGEVQANLERLAARARAAGVPVVFAIHPVFERGRDFGAYGLAALHAQLAERAGAAGLVPLDLLDGLRHLDPRELDRNSESRHDPWHPNGHGHRVIGEYLARALCERKLVCCGPPHCAGPTGTARGQEGAGWQTSRPTS